MGNEKMHREVMDSFLPYLIGKEGVILKGGTALMYFYGLTRESTAFDFDGLAGVNLENEVKRFCDDNDFNSKVSKNTGTVWRTKIHYKENDFIKIEISYRNYLEENSEINKGIRVYEINEIANQKAMAITGRNAGRDIFDIHHILKNYKLEKEPLARIKDALYYKGINELSYTFEESQREDKVLHKVDGDKLVLELFDLVNLESEVKAQDFISKTTNINGKNKGNSPRL